jgi:hypothetical protein
VKNRHLAESRSAAKFSQYTHYPQPVIPMEEIDNGYTEMVRTSYRDPKNFEKENSNKK